MRFIYLLLWLISVESAPSKLVIDTIGWTDRDRQFLGPAIRYLCYDTMIGIHAVYKNGYGEIRYNFKPKGRGWRWKEGVVINQYPRNLGSVDYNIQDHKLMISTDYLFRGKRMASYFIESLPKSGRFSEITFAQGPQHNLIASGIFGPPRFAGIKNDSLYYYSLFSSRDIGPIGPFARHNLIASKIANRFGFIWSDYSTGKLFLRETPDGGNTWYPTRDILDSVPSSFCISPYGACGVYDSIQIHIVCELYNGSNRGSVQIWHYCTYDTPPWHFIYQYHFPDTEKLGLHTTAIDRPSIGIDRRRIYSPFNILYVVWAQFDSTNIDPNTNIARSDIWATFSPDNGKSWSPPVRLTPPDRTSKRFPYLAEIVDDTLHIMYFGDQEAGCWELGEGKQTLNPVIYLSVPASLLWQQGIESPISHSISGEKSSPTLLSRNVLYSRCGGERICCYDKLGRRVDLEKINKLPCGIYFLIRPLHRGLSLEKVVKIR